MLRFLLILGSLAMLPQIAFGQAEATLSVQDTTYRTFRGIGHNLEKILESRLGPAQARALWSDEGARFRVVRLWLLYNGADSYEMYYRRGHADDAAEYDALVIGTHSFVEPNVNLEKTTDELVAHIKKIRDNGGRLDGVDFCNKPNTNHSGCVRHEPEELVEGIKMLRRKLDAAGLADVQLFAPGTIEWFPRPAPRHQEKYDYQEGDTQRYFTAIENDPEALAAIDAFASQTYGTGVTDEMYAFAKRHDKEYFQLLAATDAGGTSQPLGAIYAGQFLSDANHGVNLWTYWIPGVSGQSVDGKMQYLRSLAHAFDVGGHFMRVESDVGADMHFNYGDVEDIISAAFLNPDGSWAFGIVNLSGVRAQHYASTYQNGSRRRVAIRAPQLADAGTVEFSVRRTKNGPYRSDGTITMQNGVMQVSLDALELVTLRSTAGIGAGESVGGATTGTSGATTAEAGQSCNLITPGDQVPQGFAAPYNVLSAAQEMLVSVTCPSTSSGQATLSVGSGNSLQYIYQRGFLWKNGTWQALQLNEVSSTPPSRKTGEWIVAEARATFPRSAPPMQGNNFVVAYVCTWTPSTSSGQAGTWKCGCRDQVCAQSLWQLQVFQSGT